VYRLAYNGDVVAFKIAVGKARGGRISENDTQPTNNAAAGHFQRNPPGRGWLSVFPRCSLLTYQSLMLVTSALKNSQLSCGDITIICETVH
jgi:hypothetical protein